MSHYVTVPATDLVLDDIVIEPVSGCVARVRRIREGADGLLVAVWMLVGRSYAELTCAPDRPMRRRLRRGEESPSKKNAP